MAVIATTTLYNSEKDVRYVLACNMIVSSRMAGYPIILVDGGSPPSIINTFKVLGAEVFPQMTTSMGSSRREAMQIASEYSDVIIWQEPEKEVAYMLDQAVALVRLGACDLVLPSRMSLDSYPSAQQKTEMVGNIVMAHITGMHFDWFFGPKVIGRVALPHFLSPTAGDRWDGLLKPVLRSLVSGLSVGSSTIEYQHPAIQTAAEESDPKMDGKRELQLAFLIHEGFKEWENLIK